MNRHCKEGRVHLQTLLHCLQCVPLSAFYMLQVFWPTKWRNIFTYLLWTCYCKHTTPHHTTQHQTKPNHITPHHITPDYAILHHNTSHHTTPPCWLGWGKLTLDPWESTGPQVTPAKLATLHHITPCYNTLHHITSHTSHHHITPHHTKPPQHITPYYTRTLMTGFLYSQLGNNMQGKYFENLKHLMEGNVTHSTDLESVLFLPPCWLGWGKLTLDPRESTWTQVTPAKLRWDAPCIAVEGQTVLHFHCFPKTSQTSLKTEKTDSKDIRTRWGWGQLLLLTFLTLSLFVKLQWTHSALVYGQLHKLIQIQNTGGTGGDIW